ncbi:MAG: class I SAM-dependent methyltransferase [Planctomycetes bacterium]|nr:class I SAM-dependent methyltransferase [Planctomycetota bacterium]
MGARYDKHDLYERCVQAPELVVPFLRRLHRGAPLVLGEDFCGTAALAREWVRSDPRASAIAVDHDAGVLARAAGAERVELVHADVRAVHAPCDVLFVGNFSIGELATREELLAYLRHAHARLCQGGLFVCDTYAGAGAWRTGGVERRHWIAPGVCVHYVWEQREVDVLASRVLNALSFRVEEQGEIVEEFRDAFLYRWRLWSARELRDALCEAGFEATDTADALGLEESAVCAAQASASDRTVIACVFGFRLGVRRT